MFVLIKGLRSRNPVYQKLLFLLSGLDIRLEQPEMKIQHTKHLFKIQTYRVAVSQAHRFNSSRVLKLCCPFAILRGTEPISACADLLHEQ